MWGVFCIRYAEIMHTHAHTHNQDEQHICPPTHSWANIHTGHILSDQDGCTALSSYSITGVNRKGSMLEILCS